MLLLEYLLFLHQMHKTLIHVGYPKTATTWFVRNFYPGVRNAETIFFKDFEFNLTDGNKFFKIKKDLSSLQKEIRIVASNAFSGLINFKWNNGDNRIFFIEQLKKNFPQASIILFIRNQVDFIASGYSTYLTHGGTYTFDKLFKPGLIEGELFPLEFLNYCETIRIFQESFGKENVHIYIYEEFLENNEAFIKKFIEMHGLEISINDLHFGKANEKLRTGLAGLLRFSNKCMTKGARPKKAFCNIPFFNSCLVKRIERLNKFAIFGEQLNRKKILSKDQEEYLNNYFKSSNQELVEKFGLDEIKKYHYPL